MAEVIRFKKKTNAPGAKVSGALAAPCPAVRNAGAQALGLAQIEKVTPKIRDGSKARMDGLFT